MSFDSSVSSDSDYGNLHHKPQKAKAGYGYKGAKSGFKANESNKKRLAKEKLKKHQSNAAA